MYTNLVDQFDQWSQIAVTKVEFIGAIQELAAVVANGTTSVEQTHLRVVFVLAKTSDRDFRMVLHQRSEDLHADLGRKVEYRGKTGRTVGIRSHFGGHCVLAVVSKGGLICDPIKDWWHNGFVE